jgi:hypothetical protein
MACNITLPSNIIYSCDDVAIGGIIELHIANRESVLAGTIITKDDATRTISAGTALAGSDVTQVSFNNKDGFSVFSEVKTVTADGVVSCVPTVSVEVPKMNPAKITALNDLSKGGAELIAFVRTAAGTYHVCGLDYGLYAGTVDANSGTGRSEKNRAQLTMTGDELGLSYSITGADEPAIKTIFDTIVGN